MKVTVLGATGGIGQPLSMLMKLSPYVTKLSLYDIRGAPGESPHLATAHPPIRKIPTLT